jgi:hypothetical protein
VQSPYQWVFIWTLIGALSILASAGCNQPVDAFGRDDENSSSMIREDVYRRQLDLDVAAIVRGMATAHGTRVVALTLELPKRQAQSEISCSSPSRHHQAFRQLLVTTLAAMRRLYVTSTSSP